MFIGPPVIAGAFFKYLILLSLISLGPVLFVGTRLRDISRAGDERALLRLQEAAAVATARDFDNFAANVKEKAGLMAKILSGSGWRGKEGLLNSFIGADSGILRISVVSSAGRELAQAVPPTLQVKAGGFAVYSGDEGFVKTAIRKTPGIYFSAESGELTCYYPFGDKLFLRIAAPAAVVSSIADFKKTDRDGYLLIRDDKDHFLFAPGQSGGPETAAISDFLGGDAVAGGGRFKAGGREWLGAFALLRNVSGAVIIAQPAEAAGKNGGGKERDALAIIIRTMFVVFSAVCFISWRLAARFRISNTNDAGNK